MHAVTPSAVRLLIGSMLAALAAAAGAAPARAQDTVYDVAVATIAGETTTLRAYEGKVLLIVNTASRCGFTPQYEGLEKLWREYRERGLVVLGFPCNDFGGQEPGSEAQIVEFCTAKFDVTFPMFSKVHVKGPEQHPLYQALTAGATNPAVKGAVPWNFTKFLVARDGRAAALFGPQTTPADAKLLAAIDVELAREAPRAGSVSDGPAGSAPAKAPEAPDPSANDADVVSTDGYFVLDESKTYVYDFRQEGREPKASDLIARTVKAKTHITAEGASYESIQVVESGPLFGWRRNRGFSGSIGPFEPIPPQDRWVRVYTVKKDRPLLSGETSENPFRDWDAGGKSPYPSYGWAVVLTDKIFKQPLPDPLPASMRLYVPVNSEEWEANSGRLKKDDEGREVLVRRTVRLAEVETVETPAGTYENALRVRAATDIRTKDDGAKESRLEEMIWYAKGVGEVKIERTMTLWDGGAERTLPKITLTLRRIAPREQPADK